MSESRAVANRNGTEISLTESVGRSRAVICIGSGGVGKTTVAAAIGVRQARRGRRVVCLTIDPARRLADSLGVDTGRSAGELRDITDSLGETDGGRLSFGMLDPVATFAEFVRRRTSSPAKAERILQNAMYRYLSGSLSGMQEYMALEKLCEILADPGTDLIVLDTPPTANALDFFTAPHRMVAALDGKLVRAMRRAYGGPGRLGIDVVGRGAGGVLRAIGRVTGAELLDEIMGFVDALADLFGSFSERASTVERVLAGDDVSFCLVVTPDRATLREAREFRQRLCRLGLGIDFAVFNRAHHPPVPDPPADVSDEVRRALAPIDEEWNRAGQRESRLIEGLAAGWEDLAGTAIVPLLPEGATRIAALDRIGEALSDSGAFGTRAASRPPR